MEPGSRPRDVAVVQFTVDGVQTEVPDDGASLLEVLRDRLGVRSAKDGCSPQGQCGCCTVLVDGQPRVSCVTPARRVAGRSVTTLDGTDAEVRQAWAEAFCATGGSQCGFCTPGIVLRLEALRAKGTDPDDRRAVDRALAAHLCRCTGWQPVVEAWSVACVALGGVAPADAGSAGRDLDAAARRAALEGGVAQQVSPEVALGAGGFADDAAPDDALVAVQGAAGDWVVGETLTAARHAAGKVQGRKTTAPSEPPLALPDGDWDVALRTSWVEPAYLETDASWCAPGGEPATPLGNGGAFGGKAHSVVADVARRLADEQGRAVRVLFAREDVVRLGPKRPPVAIGARADGTGVVRVAATPGIVEAVAAVAPGFVVEPVEVVGPPTSVDVRGAGWVEAAVALGAATGATEVRSPVGATASATVTNDGGIEVRVRCGAVLDEVVLRSYCIGAVHQALGWVTSERLTLDEDGVPQDLTIRSFGILRAADMPAVSVVVEPSDDEPVNGSDAVFAAVALAVWRHQGLPAAWPTGRLLGG